MRSTWRVEERRFNPLREAWRWFWERPVHNLAVSALLVLVMLFPRMLVPIMPVILLVPRGNGRRKALDTAFLGPDPSPTQQYQVVCHIVENGVVLGEDEGVVTFSDGWLIYEGLRTRFSLPNSLCRSIDERYDWALAAKGIRVAGQDLWFHCSRNPSAPQVFYRALSDWVDFSPPVTGEPLLPPAGLGPGTAAYRWRSRIVRSYRVWPFLLLGVVYTRWAWILPSGIERWLMPILTALATLAVIAIYLRPFGGRAQKEDRAYADLVLRSQSPNEDEKPVTVSVGSRLPTCESPE